MTRSLSFTGLRRPSLLINTTSTAAQMPRNFTIFRPRPADAARIAEIHLAAMDANPLLHAQFPTPESLRAAKQSLTEYATSQLASAVSGVLVAQDDENGTIVGFAKWESPFHREDVKLESGDLQEVQGCRREFLNRYVALAEEAMARSFGKKACYRLSFVCTDPEYQGLGAGYQLTRRVLDMAAADKLPVYLESTENAISMYRGFGFREIDSFEMEIPGVQKYREVCMVLDAPAS